MNVAYIQPIFCPNEYMFNKNLNSVISFVNYYVKNGYTFKCVFGGYSLTDDFFSRICDALSLIENITIRRFDKNYGKAYIVNELATEISEVDYFLTADSDILYDIDQHDMFDRLLGAVTFTGHIGQRAGVIGLTQLENNCHILSMCNEYWREYIHKSTPERLSRPLYSFGGMAGGCIFIDNGMWKRIGGYKVLGVYCADDANLMIDCRNGGLYFWLSSSIHCIHPHEDDAKYLQWKVSESMKISEINESINNAEKFWSST